LLCYVFFFFQAEDGIRDFHVTGVQTCALPISPVLNFYNREATFAGGVRVAARDLDPTPDGRATLITGDGPGADPANFGDPSRVRSEERRVGKERRARWSPAP